LYFIGSNTKIFTSMMLFKMRDQGLVGLDTPVTQIEPRYQPASNFTIRTALEGTLGQLASHMAGLYDSIPCNLIPVNCTGELIYERLKIQGLIVPPNYRPSYSNLGFAILGRSLQNLLPNNQSYEEWVVENLLLPLEMDSSGFKITPEVAARFALGSGNNPFMTPLGWSSPAGGMYSNINDLVKFFRMLMMDQPGGLFDPLTLSEFMQPRYVFSDGQSAMGTPWEMRRIANYWARTKDGNYDGFSSNLAFVPELKLGVAFLSNDCCLDSSEYVNPILEQIIPVMETLINTYTPPSTPPTPEMFVGTFGNDNVLIVDFESETNTLVSNLNGVFGTLIWLDGLNFEYYTNECITGTLFSFPAFNAPAERVIFETDPNNSSSIISLMIPGMTAWHVRIYRQDTN